MRGCVSIETQVNPSIPTNTEIDMSSGRKVLPLNDECCIYVLKTNETASTVLGLPQRNQSAAPFVTKGRDTGERPILPTLICSLNVVPYRSQTKSLYIWVCAL